MPDSIIVDWILKFRLRPGDPKGEPQLMGADILIVDAEAAIAGLVEACLKTTASLSPSSAL